MIYKIKTRDKNTDQEQIWYEKEEFIHSIEPKKIGDNKSTGIILFGTTAEGEIADVHIEKYLISIESI
jgi:hypothetical protein